MRSSIRKQLQHMAIALLAIVFSFAGAAGISATAAELETVKPGKLVVAFNGDMPGTSWKNGKLVGLDGEIMQWIADSLGLEVEPAQMEWSAEIESVKSGRVDIMHGMMGWTAQRSKIMNISDPIYYAGTRINQRKSTNIMTFKDLEGKRIAQMTGTAAVKEVKQIPGVKQMLHDTLDSALRSLLDGRVDVAFIDSQSVQYAIKKNPDWDIKQTSFNEPYNEKFPNMTAKWNVVYGIRKEAPNLAKAINEKIAELWATCQNRKIAESYGLGEDWWFTASEINLRAGVDRPSGWKQPSLGAACK